MNLLNYFVVTFHLYFFLLHFSNAYQEDNFLEDQLTLIIEDSLDDGENPVYAPRSMIYIRSVKSGIASVTHTKDWTDDLIDQLKISADNDGLYRIRVYPEQEPQNYVSTFTKACLMYESQLSESLSLMVDASASSLIGASIFTKETVCHGLQMVPMPSDFNTTVLTRSFVAAPIPDTATYIQKIEAIKTEKAEGKDNRSFLAKYWMYLVPVVVLVMISSGGQEAGRS